MDGLAGPELTRSVTEAFRSTQFAGGLFTLSSLLMEQHPEHLLQPTVRVVFHTRGYHLQPETVDLRRSQDRIVGHEDFEHWKLAPSIAMPA